MSECIDPPKFTPYSDEFPRPINQSWGSGEWSKCQYIKCTYEGFDGERYRCDVCGESYFLDYDDMK